MNCTHVGSRLCILLIVLGGLNWGLVGIFNFNFVDFVFGTASIFTRITYIIFGLAGLYVAIRSPILMMSTTCRTDSGQTAT